MKIGVVGCGTIAKKHITGYKQLDDVEVVIADTDPKSRQYAIDQGCWWHNSFDAMLADNSISAIDICVPTPLHADFIVRALERELPVFCEKPLAENLEDCQRIKAAAERHKQFVMVGFLYRFHPAFEKVKKVLAEGVIGKPYFSILRVGGRGSSREWKHQQNAGGGAANEMLVHMLDLAVWYFGDMAKVDHLHSDIILKEREIGGKTVQCDADDIHLLHLQSKKDVCIYCQSDLLSPSYMNYLEIHGENGSIWASILDMFPTTIFCKEARGIYNQGHNIFQFERTDLFAKQLGHFVDCVRGNKKPSLNGVADSITSLEIMQTALLRGK